MREKDLLALLGEMSLEEKAGQLNQLGFEFLEREDVVQTGPYMGVEFSKEELSLMGSVLSGAGAERLKKVQKAYMEEHPHHIPLLFMFDIINGAKTIFPVPLAQGASFDPKMVKKGAKIAAREAAAMGLHVTFSPMLDTVRDPRWGRVMESTGEDPYLNSVMAKAMVKGYQGDRVGDGQSQRGEKLPIGHGSVAACIKHFAGYGAPEGGRDYATVELSNRTLTEDYLPAYKAAVKAGAELVMTSFNTLDRIPSTMNKGLLTDTLRKKWGFDGVVITDYGAIAELLEHRSAADKDEAAVRSLEAGVDIDMCSGIFFKELPRLVREGVVSEKQLDEAVLRVLRLKNALGLFENPYKDADVLAEKEYLLCDRHRKAARKAAEESFVLLKNEEQILPLRPSTDRRTAFIGPYVDNPDVVGAWSFLYDRQDCSVIREAAMERMGEYELSFAEGCVLTDARQPVLGFMDQVAPASKQEGLVKEAVEIAKAADTVVLCLGEHRQMSGEAASRAHIRLPETQMELLRAVHKVNPQVVTVLFTGRPLILDEVAELSKAVLVVWFPGVESGNAIVRTLMGKSVPSGKLPMSFPVTEGQIPVYHSMLPSGRPLEKAGKEAKFASRYIDIPNEPLYPFGYGLSYTEFTVSKVELSSAKLEKKGEIWAKVTVKNEGGYKGRAVVQLYIRDDHASVSRPVRQLKGFTSLELAPGDTGEAEFVIKEKMLRFVRADGKYASEKGSFTVWIGLDSQTDNSAVFELQ